MFILHLPWIYLSCMFRYRKSIETIQNITQTHDRSIPYKTSHKLTIGQYLLEEHYTKSRSVHTLQNNITQSHDWYIPYRTTLHKVTISPYLTEQHYTESRLVHTLQNNIAQSHDRAIPYRTTLHKLNIGTYLTVRHCANLQRSIHNRTTYSSWRWWSCESSVQDRKATSTRSYYSSRATLKVGQQDPPKR
jgi:hypothetical protein